MPTPQEFEQLLNSLAPKEMMTEQPAAPMLTAPVVAKPKRAPAAKMSPKRVTAQMREDAMGQSQDAENSANALLQELFAPQQKSADDLRAQAEKLRNTPSADPYNPLLAIADVWLGTNTAQQFKPKGLTEADKVKRLAELTDKAGDIDTAIGKQKVDLIKTDKKQESDFAKLAKEYNRNLSSALGGAMSQGQQLRYDNDMQKTLERFGNSLTGYDKSRNMKAQLTNQLGRIASMRALMNGKDYNELTNQQVAELAEGIVPVVTGTNSAAGSEARLNNFLQKNLKMDYAKFKSYLTSKPEASGQGKFVELLEDMLNREGKVRQTELDTERERTLPVYSRLYKDPQAREAFYQVAASRGLSPEEVDAHFNPKQRQAMVEAFKNSGDVPGAMPKMTKGGMPIPGNLQTAFTKIRSNKTNEKYTDEQLLQALKQQTGAK